MHPNAQHLRPRFRQDVIPNPAATEKEGLPQFSERETVKIFAAGEKAEIGVFLVNDPANGFTDGNGNVLTWAEVFPEAYQAWKANSKAQIEGTPLEQTGAFSISEVASLEALNIMSVEQLAGLDSRGKAALKMRGEEFVQRAQDILDKQKGPAAIAAYQAETEHLKRQVAELKAALEGGGSVPAEPEAEDQGATVSDESDTRSDAEKAREAFAEQMRDWSDEQIKDYLQDNDITPGPVKSRRQRAINHAVTVYMQSKKAA